MNFPVDTVFRHVPYSKQDERLVHDNAGKLSRYSHYIFHCRVVIDADHHRHKGNQYHVRIYLFVPGKELVIRKDPGAHAAHENLYVAISDSFDAAKCQLKKHVNKRCMHKGQLTHSYDSGYE